MHFPNLEACTVAHLVILNSS